MMSWSVDEELSAGQTWRDLFDLVIVSAAKPRFFAERQPVYRLVDEHQGLLEPHVGPLVTGQAYQGGDARMVEAALGHEASQFLYVGDHLFGDVHVTKDVLRWRTALIARELEAEVRAARGFADDAAELSQRMDHKASLEERVAQLRMARRRLVVDGADRSAIDDELEATGNQLSQVDASIAPLADAASRLVNPQWGPLMRAGIDKSLFARQVEKYADVYTGRVSNFRQATPYGYLRAARGSLPHDDA